ncbi:MAG: hypothetical protein A3H98_02020 [Bacteroidetes bacterium RIFCSPLOWO2_02_FULL_36_8]|nr:MAG: hypothetical protein A3H98_02020 [Bacteroidetes bacterium RIFCSPLOWO2_02_FULL_36_8]OFY69481.1 MAG: hypothetical protein A3G23_10605 [Bacteroidetes bacterium RIFCSPLOWO2_12_FULL_37_12]
MDAIRNRVQESGIVTIDPVDFYVEGERVVFDFSEHLFQGLILKEKEFREFIKNNDWSKYTGKLVAIDCSVDALIPYWAYMLVAVSLKPYAGYFISGNLNDLEKSLFQQKLSEMKTEEYADKKIMIKGCGEKPVPVFVYTELVNKLKPVVSSIMYGEPCSAVPVYKRG